LAQHQLVVPSTKKARRFGAGQLVRGLRCATRLAGSKSLLRCGLQKSDYRHQTKGFFGVYLLIRKRAVHRYIFRLLAVYVCLLANIRVF